MKRSQGQEKYVASFLKRCKLSNSGTLCSENIRKKKNGCFPRILQSNLGVFVGAFDVVFGAVLVVVRFRAHGQKKFLRRLGGIMVVLLKLGTEPMGRKSGHPEILRSN